MKRTLKQNNKLRAMCDDLSRCKPEGREHDPESWKVLMFAGWDHDRRFGDLQLMAGIEGRPPVPLNGYHTSLLTIEEMNELIAFADAYGARHGVKWGGGDYVPEADPLFNNAPVIRRTTSKPLPGHAFRVPRDPLMRRG